LRRTIAIAGGAGNGQTTVKSRVRIGNSDECEPVRRWAAATRGAIIARLAALPGHRPIVAGSILYEFGGSNRQNLLRYVCIDLYNLHQPLKEENGMPSRTRVAELISYVQAGKYVEAISEFYAETAFMKENHGEPRIGRDNLIKHERAVLAGLAQMRTERVGAVLVDGDRVIINWVFEMTSRDGKKRLLDELALQKWSGERIVEEQFYYDPAQLRPAS
jgi:SnoaL-like protein